MISFFSFFLLFLPSFLIFQTHPHFLSYRHFRVQYTRAGSLPLKIASANLACFSPPSLQNIVSGDGFFVTLRDVFSSFFCHSMTTLKNFEFLRFRQVAGAQREHYVRRYSYHAATGVPRCTGSTDREGRNGGAADGGGSPSRRGGGVRLAHKRGRTYKRLNLQTLSLIPTILLLSFYMNEMI